MYGVKPSLIRYYESEFDFFKPVKRHGERRFTAKNIEDFGLIHTLVKERGFTLDGAANEIKNLRRQRKQKSAFLDRLCRIRRGLVQLRKEL